MARTLALLSLALAAALPCAAHAQTLGDSSITSVIERDAAQYGLDSGCLEALAWQESRDDPAAVNGASLASGLFQFVPGGVWSDSPQAAAGMSPLDLDADVDAASWLQAHGYGLMGWGRDCR